MYVHVHVHVAVDHCVHVFMCLWCLTLDAYRSLPQMLAVTETGQSAGNEILVF